MLHELYQLLLHIEPVETALLRNLQLSEPGGRDRGGMGGGSLLCTENAMMQIGAATAECGGGRQWAHRVVSKAAAAAIRDNAPLADTLLEEPLVRTELSDEDVRAMLQPHN